MENTVWISEDDNVFVRQKRDLKLFLLRGVAGMMVILFIGIYYTIFMFARPTCAPYDKGTYIECDSSCSVGLSNKGNCVLLISGTDTVSNLSDVMLLVNLDIENAVINIVQIPRDTYFEYTTRSYKKINAAPKVLGGLDVFAHTLEDSFNIQIDYTVQVSLDVLSQFIDLIGGIDVNIPCDMDYEDASQNLKIHLKAGRNVLYGDAAAQFVRFRSGYVQGDVARINAQKIFMAALADKCLNGISKFKVPALVGSLIGKVNTNMSLNTCIDIAQTAMGIDISNITMMTLVGTDARTGVDHGTWYYIINREAAIETVNRYFKNGMSQITDLDFDPDRLFSGNEYNHFVQIYESKNYSINEYHADDIINNGINIDLINN